MEDTDDQTTNKAPDKPFPSGISGIHPLTQAAAALHICSHPLSAEIDINTLAEELERALIADKIDDPDEAEAILAAQSRVMNAAFTRLLIHAFPRERRPDIKTARAAFTAQRQCALTIDKLKRLKKPTIKVKDHE